MVKTTIQISQELKQELENMKIYDNETYEEIIWDLIEDRKVLSEETLKNIKEAEEELRQGKGIPFEEVLRKNGLDVQNRVLVKSR